MDRFTEAFAGSELSTAIVLGAIAAVAVGLLGLAVQAAKVTRTVPLAGLGIAAAALLALDRLGMADRELVLAVAVLGSAGLVADVLRLPGPVLPTLAAPGAWVLATRSGLPDDAWVEPTVLAFVVAAGPLVAVADRRRRPEGWGPVLFLVSAGGVFVTVPDTEQALVLLGAAAPAALLGWPRPVASLGVGGSMAVVGLLAWTTISGGSPRPGAVVGGLAALGLLLLEPLLPGRRPSLHESRPDPAAAPYPSVVIAGFVHAVLVFVVTRVGGLLEGAVPAAAVAVAAFAVTVVVAARVPWWPAAPADDRGASKIRA